jgi:nucleoside phosphorylase
VRQDMNNNGIVMESTASLPTSIPDIDKAKKSQAYRENSYFDVCIVCATHQEAETTMSIISLYSKALFIRMLNHWENEYFYTNILNNNGKKLSIHVSCLSKYGPATVGPHLQAIISMFKPHFVTLVGVCAGDKKKTKLGDLVIARSSFFYENTKFTMDTKENRPQIDLHSTDLDIHCLLSIIDTWTKNLANLRGILPKILFKLMISNYTLHQPLIDKVIIQGIYIFPPDTHFFPGFHISPMASTSTVRRDDPFDRVQTLVPETVAIDMEGAAFYRSTMEFPGISSLVVKGICDYADNDKDDTYRFYASANSAIYILSFIKEYINPRIF